MNERYISREEVIRFKEYLETEEHSSGTVDKYIRDVKRFAEWLEGSAVTKEKAMQWKQWLMQSGRASTTVNSMIAALNTFFKFMCWGDIHIKSIKLQKRFFRAESRDLTKPEYEKLINAAYREGHEKTALIMETICATGIRVSEIKYITVQAAQRGRAEIYLKGKQRVVLIPKKLCKKLKVFAKKKGLSGEIFVTRSGRSLDRRQIWAWMKKICQLAGVDGEKVFPHNLRHLFAKKFYEAYRDLASLADVLGHSSVETTRIYLVNTVEEHVKKIAHLGLVI